MIGGAPQAARRGAGRPDLSARITLIHAVQVAIPPVLEAFREGWPEAEMTNLLDDGLTGALKREGELTVPIVQRIRDLATYAARAGADGIRLVVDAAVALAPSVDVLCLAQFSMARARRAVEGQVSIPVLTSPTAAVQHLRALLG